MKTRLLSALMLAVTVTLFLGLAVAAQGPESLASRQRSAWQPQGRTADDAVADWTQVNTDGFGDPTNKGIMSLAGFGNSLYAGTWNSDTGAQLWRMGSAWSAVTTDGFGNSYNMGIDHLIEFKGNLYAGTWADQVNGGEVWRSSNGTDWSRVASGGFGDPTNAEVFRFAVFNNQLYAATLSYTGTHGAEIWRTSSGDSGSWSQAVVNGFGDADNSDILSLEEFDGYLYAGTWKTATGGEVWRSNDGTIWTQVNVEGFGSSDNWAVISFAAFGGYLYAGTYNDSTGGQVWRCGACNGSDWNEVVGNGFGDAKNMVFALITFDNALYVVTGDRTLNTEMEVWRTRDGTTWEQVNPDGFGDSNNCAPYWDNSVAVFNDSLYVGTLNSASGGELWQLLHQVFLPLTLKNY